MEPSSDETSKQAEGRTQGEWLILPVLHAKHLKDGASLASLGHQRETLEFRSFATSPTKKKHSLDFQKQLKLLGTSVLYTQPQLP